MKAICFFTTSVRLVYSYWNLYCFLATSCCFILEIKLFFGGERAQPFFTSDPELTPILASTLVAACYGCDQNRGLVLQELSVDMLLSLLKSCRQGLLAAQSDISPPENSQASDLCDETHSAQEARSRKPQGDVSLKLNHKGIKATLVKGSVSGSSIKTGKAKIQRGSRGSKTCDEWALKHNLPSSETSHSFMLHQRFPPTLLENAEDFFTSGSLEY